jgi:hypothetical protein
VSVLRSVIAVIFQSAFHLEMHQNDVFFYFKKISLEIGTSKQSENIKKLIFSKTKMIFLETRVEPRFQTLTPHIFFFITYVHINSLLIFLRRMILNFSI